MVIDGAGRTEWRGTGLTRGKGKKKRNIERVSSR